MNNRIGHTLLIFFLATACSTWAQDKKYEMSKPVNLPQVGVNKVLCMRNGNTMLFHFEPSKGVVIKVFDSDRREIASNKELCHYLDVYLIQDARFKGLFDIGGEAVLFFDQQSLISRHRLIRLRFSATNGSLIEEKLVAESVNKEKRTRFYVMSNKHDDSYAILFSTVTNYPRTADLHVEYYNNRHELARTEKLAVDRRKFDYLDVIGAEYLDSGVMVTLGLSKLLENGSISHGNTYDPSAQLFTSAQPAVPASAASPVMINTPVTSVATAFNNSPADAYGINYDEFDPTPARFSHMLAVYYFPKDGSSPRTKMADVSADIYPYHAFHTVNPFSNALNLLLFGYKDAYVMYGIERLPAAMMDDILLRMDESSLDVNFKRIRNEMANAMLKQKRDTNSIFLGAPLSVTTNENGLSTMISESFTRYANTETPARPRLFETWLGNMAVTQFDDDGNEIWGAVLPRAQYYKSYTRYYYSHHLPAKWHDQDLFGDQPADVYNRQFISAGTYTLGRDCYIVYNDDDVNFNNSLERPGDTVYDFSGANTCYYKVSSKREVTKNYLFGAPLKGEHKVSFIEGADVDEKRRTCAALVQYKRGDNISLRMAWGRLD